ncbi:MAG: GNAT family N-acetyltransferase [Deltaproteobacteria bacterium]|nr:GNAT family N-acetyltransferase [Deltaproteobacteria bacterium]
MVIAADPHIFNHLYGEKLDILKIFIKSMWKKKNNVYSHELATVAMSEDGLLGMELGYPGKDKAKLFQQGMEELVELFGRNFLKTMAQKQKEGLSYFSPYVPKDAYYLLFISVLETGRNKGIGTRLLLNVFDKARKAGFKSVHLDVFWGNPAKNLYERMGMRCMVETILPGYQKPLGIHYRMVKDLS